MMPCMLELEAFFRRRRVGKPEVSVTGPAPDAPQRLPHIVQASAHEVRRAPVSGENEDARRPLSDEQMMVTKTERARDDRRRDYPIP
jgi:hypothetical protein